MRLSIPITKVPVTILILLFLPGLVRAQAERPQWGGPSRDFVSKSKGLAAFWPETGPKQIWTRALGDGHSAIIVDGKVLYTMYSQGEQESVISLEAGSGK